MSKYRKGDDDMNFERVLKHIKNIDKKIYMIMKNGIRFSFTFCLIAVFILSIYCGNSIPSTYNIGVSLFKSGLFFLISFIICGYAFNNIIKTR